MKKYFLAICAIFALCNISTANSAVGINTSTMEYSQYVVFRTTQMLKSSDGREIYLYSNRTCELFDNGRLVVKCTYRLQNNEVRLLDENGDTVYKGSYRMSRDGRNLANITLAGTTFYKK